MDASRRDYFRQARTLQWQLGGLLVAGLLVNWLMSHAPWYWLELLCLLLLWSCAAGLFVVTARLFTRHHPTISLFNDRLWFRGFRERVVMLRNVRDAQLVESHLAGWTRRWIRLQLDDPRSRDADGDSEEVLVSLDAVAVNPDELLSLI